MLNTALAPWPSFTPEEVDAVIAVLAGGRVNYWTGEEGRIFESEFAQWIGVPHAVALANGTLALDVALEALEIGPGDEVIVTPRTFIASVSSVVNAGATPVFADVDLDSGNITPASAAAVLTERTRAIVPVHLAGWPCEMDGFAALAKAHNLRIVEDCAQAHGARYHGRQVGSLGDVGAWSFCQDKIMTTGGEGGMVTTSDKDIWSRMWSFKDHGKDWAAIYKEAHPPGFRWVHRSFGTNWRMLEMQAVIGRIQLRRMADWTVARHAHAMRIVDVARQHPAVVRAPLPETGLEHAFYRLYLYVRQNGLATGWNRDRIVAALNERGVPAMQGSCGEVYREGAFDGTPWRPAASLPHARELGETSIALLTHPTLTEEDMTHVCAALDDVLSAAAR